MRTAPRDVRAFTAYVEWDPDTELYVGTIPDVPGAHSRAASLDELRSNLKEVLELCLLEVRVEPPHAEDVVHVDMEMLEPQ